MISRRLAVAALATPFIPRPGRALGAARVIVVGGGFAGASFARAMVQADSRHEVTLVEMERQYAACPFSNHVIAGLRDIDAQRFGYDHIAAAGVGFAFGRANRVDPAKRVVRVSGADLPYDRLVLAPGIDIDFDSLPGYHEAASEAMPHAWKAGMQTLNLRAKLEAMPDGGTMLMSIPANPFRCPPGPYERASLIAYYLKTRKPRSKLLLLDAKDVFSKQRLFQAAWKRLYPDTLEWVGLSAGGRVTSVDPTSLTLQTEFGAHRGAVVNVIPPQRAGRIAALAGVADRTGWCPIDPVSFESRLVPGIHVIGDAAIAGAMPKSAFAANAQAKHCAEAVAALLDGRPVAEPRLINTCYSLVAPGYGISVAGVYRPAGGVLADIDGAGGTSPLDAPDSRRALEAQYGEAWFQTITGAVFGA